jgi:hypothetical protein
MASAAMPATARSLFFAGEYFNPTSSAAINAIANKKPPLPSFQERINVLGYATSVYKIGEISIKMAAMLERLPNMKWPSVPAEATLLSLDKFHFLSAMVGIKMF